MGEPKDFIDIKTKIKELRQNKIAIENLIRNTTIKMLLITREINILQRESQNVEKDKEINDKQKQMDQLKQANKLNIKSLQDIELEIKNLEESFIGIISTKRIIENLNDNFPILLFPIRLETRFMPIEGDKKELWVRFYPDTISIQTHEPQLTEIEFDAGCEFFKKFFQVINESDDEKKEVWRQLVDFYEPERSTWIIRTFLDNDYITNLDDYSIDNDYFEPVFKDVDIKIESWSQPPQVHIMPDCFIVLVYDKEGQMILEKQGNPIPQPLIVGPNPYSLDSDDFNNKERLFFDSQSEWIVDFKKAIEFGMGVKMDLSGISQESINAGFSKVIALGIKSLEKPTDISDQIKDLITAHHYTDGFSFIPQGTPTNNTSFVKSGYSSKNLGFEAGFKEVLSRIYYKLRLTKETEIDEESDSYRFSKFLGFEMQDLTYIPFAKNKENKDAFHMMKVLWPITWDYYIRLMILNSIIDVTYDTNKYERLISSLKHHYLEFIRANGPLPAIRIGNMPYAILPTSAYSKWQSNVIDSKGIEDPTFYEKLNNVLQTFYPIWQILISNKELIPRVGGSDDPDKELIEILGMEASSYSYYLQRFIQDNYLWNLLRFLSNNLINSGITDSILNKIITKVIPSENWLDKWWGAYQQTKLESTNFLKNLLVEKMGFITQDWIYNPEELILKSNLFNIFPWKDPIKLTQPLVTEIPSEDIPLPPAKYVEENYINWLRKNLTNTKFIEWGFIPKEKSEETKNEEEKVDSLVHVSDSILYNLLRHAILIMKPLAKLDSLSLSSNNEKSNKKEKGNINEENEGDESIEEQGSNEKNAKKEEEEPTEIEKWFAESLEYLAELPSAKLERLVSGCLDLCTHRLDAWFTSLATKRLDKMRLVNKKGIYIGAFGWIENLVPSPSILQKGEYIHAPSVSQAATAAILRSTYLGHVNKAKNSSQIPPTTINLSSRRTQKALWLCEGIRQGYSMGILLGYQFERGLHENYQDDVELDKYIYVFRKLYPLKAGKQTQMQEGELIEEVAARNVVDGLRLIKAWKSNSIPFGKDELTNIVSSASGYNLKVYLALTRELYHLDDTLDALGDLTLAEGVFQSIQGNYERAGVAADVMSGESIPPSFEVVRTPRSGFNLKHRVISLLTGNKLKNWPSTPRGKAAPYLNTWVGNIIGDPKEITCKVKYQTEESFEELSITLKDLKLGPLDFIYLSSVNITGVEGTELEKLIKYYIRKIRTLETSQTIIIDLHHANPKSFAMVLPLAKQIFEVITHARFLTPADLFLPEEVDETAITGFSEVDYNILKDRLINAKGVYNLLKEINEALIKKTDGISLPILISPMIGEMLYGSINIRWKGLTSFEGHPITFLGFPVTYSIYYYHPSEGPGNPWRKIGSDIKKTDYDWDTTIVEKEIEEDNGKEVDDRIEIKTIRIRVESENKVLISEIDFDGPFIISNKKAVLSKAVILAPKNNETHSGVITISWIPAIHSQENVVTYSIFYSHGSINDWFELASNVNGTSFEWDTLETGVEDGSDFKIKIIVIDSIDKSLSTEIISDGFFSIRNTRLPISIPTIITPTSGEILLGNVPVSWTVSIHSQGKNIAYSLYYSPDDGINWIELVTNLTETNYEWDTTTLTSQDDINYITFKNRIKVIAKDPENLMVEAVSPEPYSILHTNPGQIRNELLEISEFGISDAIPDTVLENDQKIVVEDLIKRARSVIIDVNKRLEQSNYLLLKSEEATSNEEKIKYLIESFKAIFGEAFRVLPLFVPTNIQELRNTISHTKELMQEKHPQWPILWFQQTAQTHPSIKRFETLMLMGEAQTNGVELSLKVGQLPYKENDRWLALPFKSKKIHDRNEEEQQQGSLSLVIYCPENFTDKSNVKFTGFVLDEWDEFIPSEIENTAITYQYNKPNSEPPQTLLLVIPPKINGKWNWESLRDSVLETLNMAKIRAVDLDALKGCGRFLPILYMPTDFISFYLGNTNTMEVHDLRNLNRKCQVDEIIQHKHEVYFKPGESLRAINKQGFDNCHWCIGRSKR